LPGLEKGPLKGQEHSFVLREARWGGRKKLKQTNESSTKKAGGGGSLRDVCASVSLERLKGTDSDAIRCTGRRGEEHFLVHKHLLGESGGNTICSAER